MTMIRFAHLWNKEQIYIPSRNLKAASGPPWKTRTRIFVPSGPPSRLVPHWSLSMPPQPRRCSISLSVGAGATSSATSAMFIGANPTSKHISSPCPPPTRTMAPAGCQATRLGGTGQEARRETPRRWSYSTREESLSPRRRAPSLGWREQDTGLDGRGTRVADRRWRRSLAHSYTQVSTQDPSPCPWAAAGSSTVSSWWGWRRLKRQSMGLPSVWTELKTWKKEHIKTGDHKKAFNWHTRPYNLVQQKHNDKFYITISWSWKCWYLRP